MDLGCGTGSLAILMAQAGHTVKGLDFSTRMIATARTKAADLPAEFTHGDATTPPYPPHSADVVFARHVLWALPDPAAALTAWLNLLTPNGLLLLVEGRWSTGAGLTATACAALLTAAGRDSTTHPLTDPTLWGKEIDDERYLLASRH